MSIGSFLVPNAPGRAIVAASWAATAVTAATAAAALPDTAMRIVYVVVALVLFALGCVAFLYAFALAVERSRTQELSVAGLWFLAGDSAPRPVRRALMLSLVLQLAVVFTAAGLRPFTSVAFGILVPMFGLAVAGLWAAKYGTFPKRTDLRYKRRTNPGKTGSTHG